MNLFTNLPADLAEEEIRPLFSSENLRIERIVSNGQQSPSGFWYDQEDHEWVLVLHGQGTIEYENGVQTTLAAGDHLHIPPHVRHRVSQTSLEEPTVWLAIFWRDQPAST